MLDAAWKEKLRMTNRAEKSHIHTSTHTSVTSTSDSSQTSRDIRETQRCSRMESNCSPLPRNCCLPSFSQHTDACTLLTLGTKSRKNDHTASHSTYQRKLGIIRGGEAAFGGNYGHTGGKIRDRKKSLLIVRSLKCFAMYNMLLLLAPGNFTLFLCKKAWFLHFPVTLSKD